MEHNKKIHYLHEDSEVLKDLFCDREKSEDERTKGSQLSKLVLDFYQKVFDKNVNKVSYDFFNYDFRGYTYNEENGYSIVLYDNFNNYIVNFYGDDIETAFIDTCNNVIRKNYLIDEQKNRKSIKKDYKNRFDKVVDYNSVYQAEYELSKWSIYFDGVIPTNIIQAKEKYLNYICNCNRIMIKYDEATGKFNCHEKPLTKVKK